MTPIEFYGKVVDEKGNPIAGATAKMSVADKPITDGAKYIKVTDADVLRRQLRDTKHLWNLAID